jgi:hypothetical protein
VWENFAAVNPPARPPGAHPGFHFRSLAEEAELKTKKPGEPAEERNMKLTKQALLNLRPCREGTKFAKSCGYDAVKIYNTCHRGDWMIWLLRETNTIHKPQAVLLAISCAERVLCIFEKKYPGDKRPRMAIDSVKNWLTNPTEENRRACRAPAYAAYAAYADAAYVAYAAAAADAGDAAAYAAYAGDAAYAYAAYAGDAAYATYRIKERKWQADKIRELIPCPFENL